MIILELTDQEAELFKQFRENQDVFQSLISAGLNDIKNGKMILNFNHLGEMLDIEKQVHIKVALHGK